MMMGFPRSVRGRRDGPGNCTRAFRISAA